MQRVYPNLRIPSEIVQYDIEHILWSMQLHHIRRFHGQRYWETETAASERAKSSEGLARLESVSEHSWHVADSVLLLAPHFSFLDQFRCVSLALVHDKLEILTGDFDPVGDGTGENTHAFNLEKMKAKVDSERNALQSYLERLRPSIREQQRGLHEEYIDNESDEARFVASVDRLQALAYVIAKKDGHLSDSHLEFTLRYSYEPIRRFQPMKQHFDCMRAVLLNQVSLARRVDLSDLENEERFFGCDDSL